MTTATNAQIVDQLIARGITPHDLDDTILALVHDQNSALIADMPAAASARIMQTIATEADQLTKAGLLAQVEWMDRYYKHNREHLEIALAGFVNLPLAA
jgi:hypothetical protein